VRRIDPAGLEQPGSDSHLAVDACDRRGGLDLNAGDQRTVNSEIA